MGQLVHVLDNALLQGLTYGIAVIGIAISFRVLKYPDLTADGSFLMGAVVFGALLTSGAGWCLATAGAVLAGSVTGGTTALLHTTLGVNRLLSGILTTMMCYSVAFWVLSGRSNISLADHATLFTLAEQADTAAVVARTGLHPIALAVSAILAGVVAAGTWLMLESDLGVVLRACGENQALVDGLGRRSLRYQWVGLIAANALVGLSGSLVAARQGFADVNMGFGIIITLAAALVIGEELVRLAGGDPVRSIGSRVISAVAGACGYFFLYLLILRASILGWLPIRIQPTDLKLLSALIVVAFVVLRTRAGARVVDEDVLPI